MATLVTGSALHAAVAGETFIRGGDPKAVDTVKYDLRLGPQALKASIGLPKAIDQMQDAERWIEPGEVVFVLTQEELHLPANMIATLSPKRAITHRGITVLGGFAIDPGYAGRLWFGLHNFSSSRYALRSGTKLIACLFYELTEEEAQQYSCSPTEPVTDFPDELIDLVKNYKPIELKALQEELAATKADLFTLKNAFGDDRTWKDNFQKGLDEHNKQLGILIEQVKEEKEARKSADCLLEKDVKSLTNWFSLSRVGWIVIGFAIVAVLSGLAGYYIPKWLSPEQDQSGTAAAHAKQH
jgi:deoxycytidine triphosphate deaminase